MSPKQKDLDRVEEQLQAALEEVEIEVHQSIRTKLPWLHDQFAAALAVDVGNLLYKALIADDLLALTEMWLEAKESERDDEETRRRLGK